MNKNFLYLSPPDRFIESGESSTLEPKSVATTSNTSSTSSSSGRTHTNVSNYSTTESVHNEKHHNQHHNRGGGGGNSSWRPPVSIMATSTTPRVVSSSSYTSKPNGTNAVYSKPNGLAAQPSSSSRTGGYFLRSKLERTRDKAIAMAGELTGGGGVTRQGGCGNQIERETSNESLQLKMKRSESWDAKNKIYLK